MRLIAGLPRTFAGLRYGLVGCTDHLFPTVDVVVLLLCLWLLPDVVVFVAVAAALLASVELFAPVDF